MINLDLCKKCKKRGFDPHKGIICSLTNEKPAYEGDVCPDFDNDEKAKPNRIFSQKLRPNSDRSTTAVVLIWAVLFMEIVQLLSSIMQYKLLKTIQSGGEYSANALTTNDMREGLVAILYLLVYIISGITFIRWFRRAYFNLHLRTSPLTYDEGWAAGSWFVPIINLYRPYQIMQELYVETKKILRNGTEAPGCNLETSSLGIWWALWLINGVLGNIVFRVFKDADTVDQLLTSTVLEMITSIIGIPLALLTIKVIRDYAKAEKQLK